MLGVGYGQTWNAPLLDHAERQALLQSCNIVEGEGQQVDVDGCLDKELERREALFRKQENTAYYIHLEVRRSGG
jgi:hypothetical protein